jgi:hypothetical protein
MIATTMHGYDDRRRSYRLIAEAFGMAGEATLEGVVHGA